VVDKFDGSEDFDGCPLSDVEVCLYNKRTGNSDDDVAAITCVKTSADGSYKLPATIGLLVEVRASYLNHTFVAEKAAYYKNGILVEAGGVYLNHNFRDITSGNLHVDVRGGLCPKNLGLSKLRVQILGCDWWAKEYEQVRGI